MTDNEIIKALECCDYMHPGALARASLDLINRQKNKIKRLKNENKILSINADTAFQDGLNEAQDLYAEQVKDEIKSEAIKDFAHLVIDRSRNGVIYASDIPDLVKEMTEQTTFEKVEHNSLCETETYKGGVWYGNITTIWGI